MFLVHATDRHDGLHEDLMRYSTYVSRWHKTKELNKDSTSSEIARVLENEHDSN